MKLKVLEYDDLLDSLEWRNKHMEALRTPILLNESMQMEFFEKEICNRDSKHRYWSLWETRKELKEPKNNLTFNDEIFVGVGGLTNISWENRSAEISLIISDRCQNMGLGEKAVDLLINQGFSYMNLENIYGEVYRCNEPGLEFWKKIIEKYDAETASLPHRKFYNGCYYGSLYFNINRLGVML